MMKAITVRFASVLVALCCAFTLVIPANGAYFPDVSGLTTEYRDAVNYVTDNGIMSGLANDTLTRGMVVCVLYWMSGDGKTYTEADQFTDVPLSKYYYNAVGWGVANGIVAGYDGYSQTITENITQAADITDVSAYARIPVAWAYSYGILTRSSDTAKIYPKSEVKRKDVALYAAKYRRHVEGIVFGRDNFQFTNTSGNFVSKGSISTSRELRG